MVLLLTPSLSVLTSVVSVLLYFSHSCLLSWFVGPGLSSSSLSQSLVFPCLAVSCLSPLLCVLCPSLSSLLSRSLSWSWEFPGVAAALALGVRPPFMALPVVS